MDVSERFLLLRSFVNIPSPHCNMPHFCSQWFPFSARRVSIFLISFLASYTFLLNLINRYLWDPNLYEGLFGLSEETLDTIIPTLSGLTQTMLFSVCPQIFKFVAYKEGSATSLDDGEKKAMIYFWYFYLVVRYLGQLVVESFAAFASGGEAGIIIQNS